MKKLVIVLSCLVVLLLSFSSSNIFSKDVTRGNNRPKPAADSGTTVFLHQSPLLIWGRFSSLNDFRFTGNYLSGFDQHIYYFRVHALATYQKGNIIYVVPQHFKLPGRALPVIEKAPAIMNSGN